ncbi:MAG TPA: S9 family peptidase [Vicinamibacterales bacterium]|jgi:dipeptidyl aminopeptidase/acylaminoacyl peptidase
MTVVRRMVRPRAAARLTAGIGLMFGLACLFASPSLLAARRPIADTDLFRFVWIGDPQISPDGSQVVFVRVSVNAKDNRYETALWIVPTSGQEPPRRLTAGPRDTSPRWAPDGRRIAFVRAAEKDARPGVGQLHLLDLSGGEPRPLTDLPRGCSAPEWSPDGRLLAFTTTTLPKDLVPPDNRKEPRAAPAADAERLPAHESDVRVITKATYRSNGSGYADPERHSHIWTVVAAAAGAGSPAPHQVTAGPFDESAPAWSTDGTRLFFTSNRVLEPYYEVAGGALYAVPVAGGEPAKIASVTGSLGQPAMSPDGRQVALVGSLAGQPVRSYNQPDLFVAGADGRSSAPRNLTTAYDFDIGGGIGGDQHPPRGGGSPGVEWAPDGQSIFALAAEQGRANLNRVDVASGAVTPVTKGDHEVVSWSLSRNGAKAVVLVSTPTAIGDLFVLDVPPAGSAPPPMKQITRVNEQLFSQLDLAEPEEIWYPSFDGRRINGWILKPPGFDPSKKYPLILEIHGGPHSAYGCTFTHEFSWMAAKGYVVLYTNPRGSSSYGQEFGNLIQFHYPGDDYKDLMAGVDALVGRGYVDEKRVGVTGGSGGGVLTNWTITQTTRFAAAVSQRSIADWSGFWFTADFTLFQPTWFRAAPWEDPADFAERSAITHIAKVTTPLMLVEGEADYRTPPAAGGEVMFRALKYLKKPVVMVRFPGESHELSRSGQPWHRVERLQHIVGWFDKWLMGAASDRYDVKN